MLNPSPHSTDPTGARDIDSETSNPRLSTKPTDEKKDKETLILAKPTNTSIPGIFMFLTVAELVVPIPIRQFATSHFVPSARALFNTVNETFNRVSRLRGFTQVYRITSRLPLVRMYVALAFYLRIFEIMIAQGTASQEIVELTSRVFSVFPRKNWIIPAPFVPYFTALASFKPMDPKYNIVSSILPPLPGATAARDGRLTDFLSQLLPDFVGIAKIVARMYYRQAGAGQHVLNYAADTDNSHGNAVLLPAHNAAGANAWKNTSIGTEPFTGSPHSSQRERDEFQLAEVNNQIVPEHNPGNAGIANDADVNTWTSYLLLTNSINWIRVLLDSIAPLTIPFKSNSTLDQIPIDNGRAASVLFEYTDLRVNLNATLAPPRMPLSATGSTKEETSASLLRSADVVGMTQLEMELSHITQITVSLPNPYLANANIGTISPNRVVSHSLIGPYWNAVNRVTFVEVDPSLLLTSVLNLELATARLDRKRDERS